MGTLYVVATPIGNLEDVGARALRVLQEVSVILAEDTRVTRKLLQRYDIHTQLQSHHAHSSPARRRAALERLEHGDVALVTDAGTPGVSDPGAMLVAAARELGHAIVAVPGPSAVTAALSISGMPADRYTFVGFLPRKARERREQLLDVRTLRHPLVIFATPHRLRATLADMERVLGDRPLAVARELTKRYEELWSGTVTGARERWEQQQPRGELTLIVAGHEPPPPEPWTDHRARQELEHLRAEGMGAREASRYLAEEAGRPARYLYRLWDHDRPDVDEDSSNDG